MLPSGIFNVDLRKDIAIVRTKTQWVLLILGLIILFTFPFYIPGYWLNWLILLTVWIIGVLGLHIMTGLCGQVSLGQWAFVAIGAYTTAILCSRYGFSPWATLPLAGIVGGVAGLVFGTPSLRIKGFYLVMSTLAAQFIIMWCIRYFGNFTGGVVGLYVPTPQIGGIDFSEPSNFYFVAMGLVVVLTFFAKNLQRTNTGRSFIAIRDNDLAAEVMGINLFRNKLIAFFIGCFFAGIAGWVLAHSILRVNPEQFTIRESIWALGMLTVGGIGSTTGAIMGATFIKLLDTPLVDYLTPRVDRLFPALGTQFFSAASLILFAIVVILFLIFEPRGLYHRWEIFKASYRLHPYSY